MVDPMLFHSTFRTTPALAALGLLALTACTAEPEPEVSDNATNTARSLPRLPVVESAIDREKLIMDILHAASAAALGSDDAEEQRALDGKKFEVKIRLGCSGPVEQDAKTGWNFDSESRTLRLRAAPTISMEDPMVAEIAVEDAEAAEGFWLERPWILTSACPKEPRPNAVDLGVLTSASGVTTSIASLARNAPPASSGAARIDDQSRPPERAAPGLSTDRNATPAVQPRTVRFGLVQFYTDADARTHRLSRRPLEAVETLKPGEAPGEEGFDLVLAGRLRAVPGGKVISCTVHSAQQPPDCLVSVHFDQIRMERPGTAGAVATWAL